MPTTASGNNQPKHTYFDVPATNTPEVFLNTIQRSKEYGKNQELARLVVDTLYSKDFTLREGLPIIPREYIVVGEVYMNYDFLTVGQRFILKNGTVSVRVQVLKNRRSGRMARPIILLGAVDTGSLEELADVEEVLQVLPDQIGGNILGEIHTGKSNGPGSTGGYPNAYGHSKAVLPSLFLPLFTAFKPVLVDVSSPVTQRPVLARFRTPDASRKEVKVAILDTGLHHYLPGEVYWKKNSGAVHTGWNFVDDTSDVDDRHLSLHGTRIAAIIRQQASAAVCLPVKTANDRGVCELYDVLCGLEYARVNGADIVNASFSFSTNDGPDKAIPLLHKLISVLENEGIWIVSAAGNAIQYDPGSTHGIPLTQPLLYPACYSRADNYDRILTVTTISKRHPVVGGAVTFGLDECYSPTYVDVGIIANSLPMTTVFGNDKSFKAPGFVPESEPGTSYATAYMSGLVANVLSARSISEKRQLFSFVGAKPVPTLEDGIRNQRGIAV